MFKDFVKGSIVALPFPTFGHEDLKGEISRQIRNYIKGSSHRLYDFMGLVMCPYLPKIQELEAFQKYFKRQIEKGAEQETYLVPDIFVAFDRKAKDFIPNGYIKPPKCGSSRYFPLQLFLKIWEIKKTYTGL